MARADRNAARAARSEAENEPHEFVLGYDDKGNEQVFLLRPRMHIEATSLLLAGRGDEVLKLQLVNPADWERLRQAEPEEDDVVAMIDLYQVEPGESRASRKPSTNGGRSSRRTSSTTTRSTSRKRATAPKPSVSDASTP